MGRRSILLAGSACLLVLAADPPAQGPQVDRVLVYELAADEKLLHVATIADLSHFAAVTTRDDVGPGTGGDASSKLGSRTVVHDGLPVGKYARVPAENMVFSPDGDRFAFVAVSWGKNDFGKFQVFVDGEAAGDGGHYSGKMELGAGLGPWFSPDGEHLAWPWLWKGRWRVMVDARSPKDETYDEVRLDRPWTPDGRLVAVVRDGTAERLLVDGVPKATAERIRPVQQRCPQSWQAHPLVWVEQAQGDQRLVVAHEPGPWWQQVGEVVTHGTHWAHPAVDEAGSSYLVVDGEKRGPWTQVSSPSFGPGGELAFLASEGQGWRLHVDALASPKMRLIEQYAFVGPGQVLVVGRDGARRHVLRADLALETWSEHGSFQRVHRIVAGPDGRAALSVREMDRAGVWVQGQRVGPFVDQVMHCSVDFSPDGRHVVFAAVDGEQSVVVVDGQVVRGWKRIYCPVRVSDAAVEFLAWSSEGLERVNISLP